MNERMALTGCSYCVQAVSTIQHEVVEMGLPDCVFDCCVEIVPVGVALPEKVKSRTPRNSAMQATTNLYSPEQARSECEHLF